MIVLQNMGVTFDEVQALLASVDVSEQAPADALDRLGLRLSADPETV